jgi:tetratricopeptide (TPR) repeat protein
MRILGKVLGAGLVLVGLVGTQCWAQESGDVQNCTQQGDDLELAIRACSNLIQAGGQSNQQRSFYYFARGVAYLRKGDCDAAIPDFDMTLLLAPNYFPAYANRGRAWTGKGNYDRAIQDLDQAISMDPTSAEFFRDRGVAYEMKRDHDRAIQDFDQAIRLNLNYAEAYNDRGFAYGGKGEFNRAIQDFDQAIRIHPNNALAFLNRGDAYRAKGDLDRAIQDFDQAIRIDPNYAVAYHDRSLAYRAKGDVDRATRDYEQAVRLDPTFAHSANPSNGGNSDTGSGRVAEVDNAIQKYTAAIRADPSQPQAFIGRGLDYFYKGDYDGAVQDFGQAIRLAPSDAEVFYDRGAVQFCGGRFDEAAKDFAQALQLDPKNADDALWLYLAQARGGNPGAQSNLAHGAGGLDLGQWPGIVVKFYLGSAGREAVLSASTDPDPRKARRQLAQAYFYLGERQLIGGDRSGAMDLFVEAMGQGALDFHGRAAQQELRRLTGQPKP